MGSKFFTFLMVLSILLVLVEFKPTPKDCITEFDIEYVIENDDGGKIVTARHRASEAVELVIIRFRDDVEIYQCGSHL